MAEGKLESSTIAARPGIINFKQPIAILASTKGSARVEAWQRRAKAGAAHANTKDGDVIVVDSSVLIHGLYQVKKWCRDGREEVLIVPLEALNTLDLLKKGTSPIAQRARAASRILEAQVGTNPRIRVQQDDAFVLWDSINLAHESDDSAPEWVRRIISCARWEKQQHAAKKVVIAVLAAATPATPPTVNKYEIRATGALVNHWASRTGLDTFAVSPTTEDDKAHNNPRTTPRRSSDHVSTGMVVRPPAVKAMMDSAIAQPRRVVKVLRRGETLEPDP